MASGFQFGHMTDSHLFGSNTQLPQPQLEARYAAYIEEVAAHGVDFIVHTGDMCTGNAGVENNTRFRDVVQQKAQALDIPYYFVRGNHDSYLKDAEYVSIYGHGNYWFAHQGWAFIVLDRYWRAYESLPFQVDPSAETLAELAGFLAEIAPATPIVLAMHENPVGVSGFPKGDRLHQLFAGHNLQLVLFGHVQCNYIARYAGVKLSTVAGEAVPFDSSPLSYQIVQCQPDGSHRARMFPYRTYAPEPTRSPLPKAAKPLTPDTDWLEHRGPLGTRYAAQPISPDAPALAWELQLPGDLCVGSLNTHAGVAYVGTKTRGNFAECTVCAVDLVSGQLRWRFEVDGSVEGGVRIDPARGQVYAATTSGSVYALELASGALRWQWNNTDNLPFACEPALHEGLLHLGANWEMFALEAGTGRLRWRRLATRSGISYFSPGHSSPVVVGERVVHARPYNGNPVTKAIATSSTERDQEHVLLQTVNAATGRDLQISSSATFTFPAFKMGCPIVHRGHLYMLGYGLFEFALDDLIAPTRTAKMHPGGATPAAHGNRIYVPTHHKLFALDLDTWESPWELEFGHSCFHYNGLNGQRNQPGQSHRSCFAAPLLTPNALIAADGSGTLQALDPESGEQRWQYALGEPLLSAPTLSGNALLVGTTSGRLLAFAV